LPVVAPQLPFSARLRARIDAFLAETGMSPTEFGQRVINDTSLYTRIKRGRPISSNTIDIIEQLMLTYDPSNPPPLEKKKPLPPLPPGKPPGKTPSKRATGKR
jgi:hypothetical protein